MAHASSGFDFEVTSMELGLDGGVAFSGHNTPTYPASEVTLSGRCTFYKDPKFTGSYILVPPSEYYGKKVEGPRPGIVSV